MVDYISYDIVEYSTDIKFNTNWYPERIPTSNVTNDEVIGSKLRPWYTEYLFTDFGMLPSYVAEENTFESLYALTIQIDINGDFPVAEGADEFVLYYIQEGFYVRADIPTNTNLKTDVMFLYDFGNFVVAQARGVYLFLLTEVIGIPIYYIVIGSGFAVYVGWVIVKFVIDL